jgi:hypothetical protein
LPGSYVVRDANGQALWCTSIRGSTLLDESSRSDPSHDCHTQIVTELVPSTLPPAAITGAALLEEGRLITGLLELYLSQLHVSTKVH